MAARWKRHEVLALVATWSATRRTSAPRTVDLEDVGSCWRVSLTFDAGDTAAVDAWLARLVAMGAEVDPEDGAPRVYPPSGAEFRSYAAQTAPFGGYRWALRCRVARNAQVVTS